MPRPCWNTPAARPMGSVARALADHFTGRHLALPTDQGERLATGRRQRRIDVIPGPLRPAAAGFSEHLFAARERPAGRAPSPRTDGTTKPPWPPCVTSPSSWSATAATGLALADLPDVEAFSPRCLKGHRAAPHNARL